MIIDRKKILALAKRFVDLCEKNNIWYSLDRLTLLGAIKQEKFLPEYKRFEVFVTVKGYLSLKRLFPQNIVDSHESEKYKNLSLIFLDNKKNWEKEKHFIYIRVAVPTTIIKLKHFVSLRRTLKHKIKFQRDNIRTAIDDLYDPTKFQGYYLLENKSYKKPTNWIQVLTKKQEVINLSDIKVKIFSESKKTLSEWYGDNYMGDSVASHSLNPLPNPIDVIEES